MRETAVDHQVIYLTCSDRYDAIADKVIVLDAPAGRDTEAEASTEADVAIAAVADG